MKEGREEEEFLKLLDEYFPSEATLSEMLEEKRGGEKAAEKGQQDTKEFGKRRDDFRKFFWSVMNLDKEEPGHHEKQERFAVWCSTHQPVRLYALIRVAVGRLDQDDQTYSFLHILATNKKIEIEHVYGLARFLMGALRSDAAREAATELLFDLRPMSIAIEYLAAALSDKEQHGLAVDILKNIERPFIVCKKIIEAFTELNESKFRGIRYLDDPARGTAELHKRREAILKFLEEEMPPRAYATRLTRILGNPDTAELAAGIFRRMNRVVAEDALRWSSAKGGYIGEKAALLLTEIESSKVMRRRHWKRRTGREVNMVPFVVKPMSTN